MKKPTEENIIHKSESKHSFCSKESSSPSMFDIIVLPSLFKTSTSIRYALYGSLLLHLSCIMIACIEFLSSPTQLKKINIPTKSVIRTIKLNATSKSMQRTHNECIADMAASSHKHHAETKQLKVEEETPSNPHQKKLNKKEPQEISKVNSKQIENKKTEKKKIDVKKKQQLASKKTSANSQQKEIAQARTVENQPKKIALSKNVDKVTKQRQDSIESDVDDSLLSEALENLNSTSTHIRPNSSGSSQRNKPLSSKNEIKMIGQLYAEQNDTHGLEGNSSSFTEASHEAWYIMDLIRRLQLHVRLLEPGMVRIILTIKRDGRLTDCSITHCANTATKNHLKNAISKIKFAPFGEAFPREQAHEFRLKLEDNGTWSF